MIGDPHVEKIIQIGEENVPVWLYGNPKNPPIVFLHGYFRGFSDYVGDLPPRYLMKKYYVIAFDLPGFGKSKNLTISSLELIDSVVKHVIPDRKFTIFGGSWGGAISLRYACQNKSSLQSLIIAALPVYGRIMKLFYVVRHLVRFGKIPKLIEDLSFVSEKNLSGIKIPVLLLYSAQDKLATIKMGVTLNKMLPSSKMFTVKNRSHTWFAHRIDETGILSEIEKFITKLNA